MRQNGSDVPAVRGPANDKPLFDICAQSQFTLSYNLYISKVSVSIEIRDEMTLRSPILRQRNNHRAQLGMDAQERVDSRC